MSGPDAVAKMSNIGASGSFSSDYHKYMESKKNRHSFSAGNMLLYIDTTIIRVFLVQTGPRRRLVRSAVSTTIYGATIFHEIIFVKYNCCQEILLISLNS